MNILHLTNTISEGGVESYLLQLLPELNKENNCSLFVLNKNKTELKPCFQKYDILVLVNRYASIYNPLVIFDLYKIARKYDVIHSHLFPTQYYIAFLKFLFLLTNKNIKFVTTEHCTTNKRRKSLYRWIEKIAYSAYDKIVGVSEASAKNLKEWIGDKKDKIETIPNGIDLHHITDALPYSKEELGIPKDAFVLCMTARFFSQKDHETLIKALQYLPDNIILLLIGSGENKDGCIALSKNLGLDKRIKFLGRRRDVASIIKVADICILSTHYEGLPVSILEYFCAGKPVIATNVDGVREMFEDESLLSAHHDPVDLSEKIINLYTDTKKMEMQAISNYSKIETYSLENMSGKYLRMYESLYETVK